MSSPHRVSFFLITLLFIIADQVPIAFKDQMDNEIILFPLLKNNSPR